MSYFDSIYASSLPSRAVNVYRYLRDCANENGQCWPSVSRIAKDLHCSESTVKRAIRELEQAGFIAHESRYRTYRKKTYGKTSNLYTLLK